ncbi:NADPH-dependent FMN reductase [Clostridium pasteurianum DSM 525 = ATCC 6013]|uniref:NADPH-dependent FMN reductase n=1 Tax=Clostridium pasteurianum DSM 525 = ATCC 6013 TaxID=1262449 RepID=A0A0H3J5H0_CLOPA|nr:flavodoxin family protein [Clostridium pasteurianum]AJA49246.1 NADPH-dependent FMN reductase [Clostridium pasteurianum DSM 525 = ATCC 6013]AJA53234.1 NADPH-dependent FMN reductase [Clostridium pasteurianum DSM 525 = ATCC 6013]AOZ76425.1 flavodoxin [Clostridium pasteurianum DSM 525 = ATCC 6013]AOZ80222.1 flavodoxin [Clostridium pasteurianum]ELP58266.1 multimeric flavodoxin WrbA [Clostridium pasteurianum DSM 525 = ATCC 6013]
MKAIAVNGSPRKEWNTATLLKRTLDGAKSVGAETEMINLYNLNYKGCISCFACKRKDSKFVGHCAVRDDLTEVLEKVITSDVLLLGSPIYLGNVTGEMSSFLERLIFMNISYSKEDYSNFQGKINAGFIYTMNVPQIAVDASGYQYIFDMHKRYMQLLNGTNESLIVTDTYQFDDYNKYDASRYDEQHKAQIKAEQFPIDCEKAFQMGKRLATYCKI